MKINENKSDELYEKIIKETLKLYQEKSIKFTMDEIAKNLSVSKKTIYKYFENKEILIVKCIDFIFEDIYEKHNKISKEDIIPVDKLKKILAVYPSVYNAENINMQDLDTFPKAIKRIEMHLNSNWEITFKILEECKKLNLIKPIDNNYFRLIMVGLFKSCLEENTNQQVLERCIEYIFVGILK